MKSSSAFAAVALAMAILATTTTAQDFTEDEKALFVQLHNDARAAVGVSMPEVSWDETVAAMALEHASTCQFEHIPGPYGENLWAGGWVGTPADAMKSWVDNEKPFYDYGRNQCVGGDCLHYTQVVWSRTTQIGCARVTNCNIDGQYNTLIACNYDPRGNMIGERPY